MKNTNINKTLFFYYIIKTDNALEIICNNKKTYFNTLLINYFGEIIPEIQNKHDFLLILQNDINDLIENNFKTNIVVVLDNIYIIKFEY